MICGYTFASIESVHKEMAPELKEYPIAKKPVRPSRQFSLVIDRYINVCHNISLNL